MHQSTGKVMTTVVVAPFNVVNFPEGGGRFWVYMQDALGLRQLGCDVLAGTVSPPAFGSPRPDLYFTTGPTISGSDSACLKAACRRRPDRSAIAG
jgi:hypothetical protein